MKKLITLFILFLGLGIANAQEAKPTKEETLFILRMNYEKEVKSVLIPELKDLKKRYI